MAGHRQAAGKPQRIKRRAEHHRGQLAAAPTIEAQLSAAFDWWRAAARRRPDAEQRIITLATRLANEAHAMEVGR